MNQQLTDKEKFLMHKKKCPEKFRKVFLQALSYFPELHDTYIFLREMCFYGVQHTCRSYPPLVTLHWQKSKWGYPIVINKNKSANIPFDELTFEEQVGFLVHELSHTTTYINFSRRDIARFSMNYLFNKKFVQKIEEETDLKVIKNGAGLYLLDERICERKYRINNPYPEVADTYLPPSEIIENLKKYPNLYPKEKIGAYISKLEATEKKYLFHSLPQISFTRKIKHAIKTVVAFIPAFTEMFYIITIKKVHLK